MTASQASPEIVGYPVPLQPGERYAGLLRGPQGVPLHHLVLLGASPGKTLRWHAAMEWANSVGGVLPNREELNLLYTNCKPHLEREWHWSSETHAEDASHAWDCDFVNGLQLSTPKSYDGCAIAVRRVPI